MKESDSELTLHINPSEYPYNGCSRPLSTFRAVRDEKGNLIDIEQGHLVEVIESADKSSYREEWRPVDSVVRVEE